MVETIVFNNYILFWVCIIGLCLGSFYNVVILRSLDNESIIYPPSKCPKCGNKLKPWHNIPILSYIFLRGKCAFCKEKISIQYPIIEFLTMVLFAISYIKFGFTIKTLFAMFWVSTLIIMSVTDIREKLVDCDIAIALGVSGVLYNCVDMGLSGGIRSVLGLIIGIVVIEIISRLGILLANTKAMGEADTYVAAALGAIVGFQNIGWVLLYGLVASMIIILPMFLYNRYKSDDKLTCILSILFILAGLVFKSGIQNYWTIGAVASIGIMLAWAILKGLEDEGNRNYLPYVPALSIGFLYFLFI